MTWNTMRRVVFATGIVGALALASGAGWLEQLISWLSSW
jgi:hypothetical protein